jgi:hypothetical protein
MRTITEVQYKLCKKLSSDEMALVKGGTKVTTPVIKVSISTNATPISVASDDKRRERPGGGINTL